MILWLGKRDYWETILLPNSPKKYNPPPKKKTQQKNVKYNKKKFVNYGSSIKS